MFPFVLFLYPTVLTKEIVEVVVANVFGAPLHSYVALYYTIALIFFNVGLKVLIRVLTHATDLKANVYITHATLEP